MTARTPYNRLPRLIQFSAPTHFSYNPANHRAPLTNAAQATVTVNNRPTYRKGDYFRNQYPVNNQTGAVYVALTNLAVLNDGANPDIIATNIGWAYLPQSPEVFGHDADGNLTNDGRFAYSWDAENRLTNIVSLPTAHTASRLKLDFTSDYMGRRVQKIVSTNSGANWVGQYTHRFVYDGWNLLAILDGGNNIQYSFRWGVDASGTMQGAGGVGGLLSMRVHTGPLAGAYFYCYDGNFNVVGLINVTNGAVVAEYEYGPFGELIRATGPLAKVNPFLFSTKYQDWETGLYYYGFRYYNPSCGRWLSRDPIGERGGVNLYGFVGNETINKVDAQGLASWVWDAKPLGPRPPERGLGGETIPKTWMFDVWVNPQQPCHYIRARGVFEFEYWWSVTTYPPENGGGTYSSRPHEETHVEYYHQGYLSLRTRSEKYLDKCMCPAQARCFREAIWKMWVATQAHVKWQNDDFDCKSYGNTFGACDRAPGELQDYLGKEFDALQAELTCTLKYLF